MKKILFVISTFLSAASFAQDSKIALNKGQKITVTSTATVDAELMMGMNMKLNSTVTNSIVVISDDDKNYKVSNTVTKAKMEGEMMGQQMNYDSEKPGDKDSELGKEMSKKINIPDTILLEKTTGKASKASPERAATGEENPMEGFMKSLGGGGAESDAVVASAFMFIPKDKKTGDTWVDSSSTKNIKSVKNYTLKSIDKNIATVLVNATTSGNGEAEIQGTAVTFEISSKSTSEITVDTKNGQVSKNVSDVDMSINMELMGQQMPMSSKSKSTAIYQ